MNSPPAGIFVEIESALVGFVEMGITGQKVVPEKVTEQSV